MYERILEAIQQLREQGVELSKIKMTTNYYYNNYCAANIWGLEIEIDDTIDDFIIM